MKTSQQREVCSNYHLSLPGALLARGTFGQPICRCFDGGIDILRHFWRFVAIDGRCR